MSRLAALKSTRSLRDFAPLLGLPPSALAFTLYRIPPEHKYSTFEIPKKSGGTRRISAPIDRLKNHQRALASLLNDCRAEIEKKNQRKIVSHAFRADASILSNANQHRRRRYVLNLDLEEFFPTFNFGRIRGFFIKNRDFQLNEDVATVIAQIACHGNALPQGSPCSPIISDLLAHMLDVRVLQLAKKWRCTYSRYADDLTFSTNRREFPAAIAFQVDEGSSAWALGDDVLYQIDRAGFKVNHKKTRMQYRTGQQIVTGLTVNEKVNIRKEYYRAARGMCSTLFATGSFHKPIAEQEAPAQLNPGTIAQLEGIVNHIYFVKSREQARATSHSQSLSGKKAKGEQHGIDRLYHRLLFFKKFVALERPLVICEGKTDNIYLDIAATRLPAYNGILFDTIDGKSKSRISYFTYTNITREIMNLGGGSGSFAPFISRYGAMMSHYKSAPLAHPVILLIDNDSGANPVFSALKHITVNHSTTLPFYEITRNLYLVKTPEAGPHGGQSKIEDMFNPALLATKIGGKSFNPEAQIDPTTEYGKTVFAERVVAAGAAKINFAGFVPLLDRFVAVIQHHAARVSAGPI